MRLWLSRLGRCVVAVLLTAITLLVLWFAYNFYWSGEKRFGEIRAGMTKEEVQHILGRPPGNYTSKPRLIIAPSHYSIWNFDDGTGAVIWDQDGNAKGKVWTAREPLTLSEMIRQLRKKIGV